MNLTFASLRAAVAAFYGAPAGERLADALAAYRADDAADTATVERHEIGPMILACALPTLDASMLAELPLHGVTLASSDGRTIELTAADAFAHPLLERWVGLSLGDMVTNAAMLGAAIENVTGGAPGARTLDVVVTDGYTFAKWELSFAGSTARVSANLQYGAPIPTAHMITLHRISGESIYSAGVAAANPSVIAPAPDATLSASDICKIIFGGGEASEAATPVGFVTSPGGTVH